MDNHQDNGDAKKGFVRIVVIIALALVFLFVVIPACQVIMMATGTYQIDTATFRLTDPATASGDAPGVWIDTNHEFNFLQKTIKSSKPYSIAIDYTDETFTYASAEFTDVKITYDDGVVETSHVKLPLVIQGRPYTATNSVSGGRIVKTKLRVMSGKIPDIITRDQPFTLEIQGHFNMDDGSQQPFKIEQHYDLETDKSEKPAMEVLRDG